MFVGTFDRTIDAKGRLALPPRFRSKLVEGGYLSTLQICLGVWTYEGFQTMSDRLERYSDEGRVDATMIRNFFSFAEEFSVDGQGRITIPARLRDSAGIDKDVVLTGRNTRVEIFAPSSWQRTEDPASVAAAFEALAL